MKKLFNLRTDIDVSIFKLFDDQYSNILISYCPPLSKVTIDIYTSEEEAMGDGSIPSPYSYSISENMYAKIVFDKAIIESLEFSRNEQMAAIAHEIGHIVFQFLENKQNYTSEEIFADELSCKLGLTTEIYSVICKLENSDIYNDATSRFGMRKLYISGYCKGNQKIDGVLIKTTNRH